MPKRPERAGLLHWAALLHCLSLLAAVHSSIAISQRIPLPTQISLYLGLWDTFIPVLWIDLCKCNSGCIQTQEQNERFERVFGRIHNPRSDPHLNLKVQGGKASLVSHCSLLFLLCHQSHPLFLLRLVSLSCCHDNHHSTHWEVQVPGNLNLSSKEPHFCS